MGDVAHQSFSFRTRSNGLFRLPQCFIFEPCGPSVRDSGLAPSDRRPPAFFKRPKLTASDRFLWSWLSSVWHGWEARVFIIQAATLIGWYRKGFGLFCSWKIHRSKPGRPAVPTEVRELIRMLSR